MRELSNAVYPFMVAVMTNFTEVGHIPRNLLFVPCFFEEVAALLAKYYLFDVIQLICHKVAWKIIVG